MAFSVDDLTLGEIGRFESITGLPITAIVDDKAPKGEALAVLVMLKNQRVNPKYTKKEAEALTMSQALEELGLGVEEDPKEEN